MQIVAIFVIPSFFYTFLFSLSICLTQIWIFNHITREECWSLYPLTHTIYGMDVITKKTDKIEVRKVLVVFYILVVIIELLISCKGKLRGCQGVLIRDGIGQGPFQLNFKSLDQGSSIWSITLWWYGGLRALMILWAMPAGALAPLGSPMLDWSKV